MGGVTQIQRRSNVLSPFNNVKQPINQQAICHAKANQAKSSSFGNLIVEKEGLSSTIQSKKVLDATNDQTVVTQQKGRRVSTLVS